MNDTSDQPNKFLPIWVWIVVLVQILLVLFFSVGTALSPADFIPDASELTYVTQLYITRNVTIALGIIVALLLKSHKGLLTVLVVRVLTDVADVISVYAMDVDEIKSSVPMVLILLIIPASLAIGYFWKKKN
jgi:ABC-type nickel/cobalt efflux system permease component RcnA